MILAVAGAGKTSYLLDKINTSDRFLIVTYTIENQESSYCLPQNKKSQVSLILGTKQLFRGATQIGQDPLCRIPTYTFPANGGIPSTPTAFSGRPPKSIHQSRTAVLHLPTALFRPIPRLLLSVTGLQKF